MADVPVGVIDYGAGNLRSLSRALGAAGARPVLIRTPVDRKVVDALVLPGVGAFGAAMQRLDAAGLPGWIGDLVASGMPLIGVCLGMQLLYERSDESGGVRGLALLRGAVRRLPSGLKIPHMGWNQLRLRRPSPIVEGVAEGAWAYFVHSYVVEGAETDDVVATTSYGPDFPAIVEHGLITGLQFHPEKSGVTGHLLLRNMVTSVVRARPAASVRCS